MNNICTYCNCKLRPFKITTDWTKRSLHKTCYFKKKDDDEFKEFLQTIKDNKHNESHTNREIKT